MRIDNVHIAGIGTWLPDRVSTSEAVQRGWYDAEACATSGMISIGMAGEMPAPDMAVSAARIALKRAEQSPDQVGGLIHSPIHFQGPEGWSAVHYILHNTVDRPVTAMELRQGCLGMVTSIRLASSLLMTDPSMGAFLLTAADNFGTALVDRWRASSHYVMGDGGSAAVLSNRQGFARVLAAGSVSAPEAEILHRAGEPLFPPSITVGGTLDVESRARYWQEQWAQGVTPPTFHLGDLVCAATNSTLAEVGLTTRDIAKVAGSGVVHEHVLAGLLHPLGFTEEQSTWEFTRRLGHSGGTDQIAGLEYLLDEGGLAVGDKVLLLSVTIGMEVGVVVLEIESLP